MAGRRIIGQARLWRGDIAVAGCAPRPVLTARILSLLLLPALLLPASRLAAEAGQSLLDYLQNPAELPVLTLAAPDRVRVDGKAAPAPAPEPAPTPEPLVVAAAPEATPQAAPRATAEAALEPAPEPAAPPAPPPTVVAAAPPLASPKPEPALALPAAPAVRVTPAAPRALAALPPQRLEGWEVPPDPALRDLPEDLPRALQEALIDANCLAGTADGQFGAKSQAALAAFYANADPALGLTPKTEIGVAVWKDLHQVMGKSPVQVCPEAPKPAAKAQAPKTPAPKAQAPAKVSAPKAQAPAKQPAAPKPAAKPAKPAGDGGCTGKLTASQMAACAG